MSFMKTKFHEILLSGFKSVAMTKNTHQNKQSNTPGQTEWRNSLYGGLNVHESRANTTEDGRSD